MKITEMKEVTTSEWEEEHDMFYLQGTWIRFNKVIDYIEALEEEIYQTSRKAGASRQEFIRDRLYPIRKKHIGDIEMIQGEE